MPPRARGLGLAAAQAVTRRAIPPATGDTAPPAAAGGIVAALRDSGSGPDSDGLRLLALKPSAIAENPANPRATLSGLDELAQSIKRFGLLQPVVVVDADTYLRTHPQHRTRLAGKDWVLIAGARRRAAGELAGDEPIPAFVRDDLAGDPITALGALLRENFDRVEMNALEEARGFQLLIDAGATQRQVGESTGRSQSHVSKRLSLLTLPQQAQDALLDGTLAIGDALALAAAPAGDRDDAWTEVQRGRPVSHAVSMVARRRQTDRAKAKSERRAAREGIRLVDPVKEWGSRHYDHALYDQRSIDAARERGHLVAHISDHDGELRYYTTHLPAFRQRADTTDRHRKAAAKARAEACATLVTQRPAADVMLTDLAGAVLHGNVQYAEALKLAHKWLGDKIGAGSTPYEWRDSLAATDAAAKAWVAWAMTVAGDEVAARWRHSAWDTREQRHVQRLIDRTGYQPTAWERKQLDGVDRRNGTDTGEKR